jgi:hypothetical protein
VADLVLVPDKSSVRIHTFAEGMFSRLAHDLELRCTNLEGRATRREGTPDSGSATLEVPISGIQFGGILHGDRVDEGGLPVGSPSDVIEKMHKDVFQGRASGTVRIEATLDAGSARIRLVPPNGRAVERTARPTLEDLPGGEVRVKGMVDVSLAAIGSATVKGPMGAFRVKDRIEVLFDVVFAPT